MNCGLGNLDILRQHLLAGTMAGDKSFDAVIADIGRGVASVFEQQCNRRFAYAAGDVVWFPADHDCFVAPRYPLYSVDAIQRRDYAPNQFQDITGWLLNFDRECGMVRFAGQLGTSIIMVKMTFTGGYWFETAEPEGEGVYPSQAPLTPDGTPADALPQDLRFAWLMQCRHVWASADKLGSGVVNKPNAMSALAEMDLIQSVKRTLQNYQRMQMS